MGDLRKKIMKCVVCRIEIIVQRMRIGSNKIRDDTLRTKIPRSTYMSYSEEGILFGSEDLMQGSKKWFCNDCWAKILKKIKIQKLKKLKMYKEMDKRNTNKEKKKKNKGFPYKSRIKKKEDTK